MATKSESRVYVGTYGKYNAGNLAGAWLNPMHEFSTMSVVDFLAKIVERKRDGRPRPRRRLEG
jgi:hypothetical protein